MLPKSKALSVLMTFTAVLFSPNLFASTNEAFNLTHNSIGYIAVHIKFLKILTSILYGSSWADTRYVWYVFSERHLS